MCVCVCIGVVVPITRGSVSKNIYETCECEPRELLQTDVCSINYNENNKSISWCDCAIASEKMERERVRL